MPGGVAAHPQHPGHEDPAHDPRHAAEPARAVRAVAVRGALLRGLPGLQRRRRGADLRRRAPGQYPPERPRAWATRDSSTRQPIMIRLLNVDRLLRCRFIFRPDLVISSSSTNENILNVATRLFQWLQGSFTAYVTRPLPLQRADSHRK